MNLTLTVQRQKKPQAEGPVLWLLHCTVETGYREDERIGADGWKGKTIAELVDEPPAPTHPPIQDDPPLTVGRLLTGPVTLPFETPVRALRFERLLTERFE